MPDKVLICKYTNEGFTPKCIYTNRRIKEFFGGDLVRTRPEKEKNYKKQHSGATELYNVPIKNPISRRIFREQDEEVALVDTIYDDEKKLSLSEIIMKHQA